MDTADTHTHEPPEVDPRDRALLEKVGRLRVRSWATFFPDLPNKMHAWLDNHELIARHWAMFPDGEPIAARLSLHQRIEDVPDAEVYAGLFLVPLRSPIASFSRLVVHPSHRGRSLSPKLDAVRMSAARSAGAVTLVAATPSGPKPVDRRKAGR